MAFLDEVGKMLSDATTTTINKGKDLSDMAKLNLAIKDEQRVMAIAYDLIGKKYYELHATDFEPAFAEDIQALNASKEKIAEYERKLSALKGERTCPSCGKAVPKTTAFCTSCGAKMPEEVAPAAPVAATAFCTKCGAPLASDSRFCTGCGQPVEATPVQSAQPVEATPTDGTSTVEATPADSTPTAATPVDNIQPTDTVQ